MAAKARNLFVQTVFTAGLILSVPAFAFAASNYGDCAYGSQTYGGDCTPATTPTATKGGSGPVVGSGPNAPGYVNTNPYGTTTASGPSTVVTTTPANPAQSTTPTATGYSFTRDLDIGSTGSDVTQLQVWLNTNGYVVANSGAGSPGNESAYFGPATQTALANYQAAKGITPSAGYFGPKTRAAVSGSAPAQTTVTTTSASTTTGTFTRDLQWGDTGSDVTALQQYLNAHGYLLANFGIGSIGNETDYFGDATKYQLSLLQAANGITPAAGYFGPLTRSYVNSH